MQPVAITETMLLAGRYDVIRGIRKGSGIDALRHQEHFLRCDPSIQRVQQGYRFRYV
jgi:hypothetical protein